MQTGSSFWNFSAGQVSICLGIITLLITVFKMHKENIKQIVSAAERLQNIENKMETMYTWFEDNVLSGKRR